MWYRIAHLSPLLRVALVVFSSLGLLAAGFVLATGALRGEAANPDKGVSGEPGAAQIPPMDRETPERVETATFALG